MKPIEITEVDFFYRYTANVEAPLSGLYSYTDDSGEDDPWDIFSHIIYLKDNHVIWTIDYSHGIILFSVINKERIERLPYHLEVSREVFIDFVKNQTPDAMEWIIFNLDRLLPVK